MTPAILAARAAEVEFAVREVPAAGGPEAGCDAAAQLGVAPERVFKTLVTELDGRRLALAVLPLSSRLDLRRLAAAAGARRAALAPALEAERATGYAPGAISPLGTRRALPTFLDASALAFPTLFVSGGRPGLELGAPALQRACQACVVPLARE